MRLLLLAVPDSTRKDWSGLGSGLGVGVGWFEVGFVSGPSACIVMLCMLPGMGAGVGVRLWAGMSNLRPSPVPRVKSEREGLGVGLRLGLLPPADKSGMPLRWASPMP